MAKAETRRHRSVIYEPQWFCDVADGSAEELESDLVPSPSNDAELSYLGIRGNNEVDLDVTLLLYYYTLRW